MEASKSGNDTGLAIATYFVFFLPLVMGKKTPFLMFHANQSLLLLLVSIVSGVVGVVIPVLGTLVSMIVSIAVLIFWIMGIISAANGEKKPIPYIGQYTLLK